MGGEDNGMLMERQRYAAKNVVSTASLIMDGW